MNSYIHTEREIEKENEGRRGDVLVFILSTYYKTSKSQVSDKMKSLTVIGHEIKWKG